MSAPWCSLCCPGAPFLALGPLQLSYSLFVLVARSRIIRQQVLFTIGPAPQSYAAEVHHCDVTSHSENPQLPSLNTVTACTAGICQTKRGQVLFETVLLDSWTRAPIDSVYMPSSGICSVVIVVGMTLHICRAMLIAPALTCWGYAQLCKRRQHRWQGHSSCSWTLQALCWGLHPASPTLAPTVACSWLWFATVSTSQTVFRYLVPLPSSAPAGRDTRFGVDAVGTGPSGSASV